MKRNRTWRRLIGLLSLATALGATLAGCGQGGGDLMPVNGKVTADGQPLTTGAVTFHPDATKGNTTPHIPVGMIDEQGNYKLMSANREGAPPGWYKVTVIAEGPPDEKNPYAPRKSIINRKFADVQSSRFEVEVVEKPAPGAYDFAVTK
jgi:predicted small lipoprotein YifL